MRATQPLQRPGSITLVCTDGSSRTTAELRRGLRVASNAQRTVVATVVRPAWPVDQIAGVDVTTGEPQLTLPADQRREDARRRADALTMLEKTCTRLNLDDAEMVVLHSAEPARALRKLAASLPASVIILGGGERSRVTRALCGSVTRHLIRDAPCPVIIGHTPRQSAHSRRPRETTRSRLFMDAALRVMGASLTSPRPEGGAVKEARTTMR